jgi:DNA (cytosine-5)-methyltransferase 1
MRYLSLFSGLEGASLAWGPLGWECVAVAETDPACCAVLDCRWPGIPNLGDVRKITEGQVKDLGHIDLVVFGSPCQDVSIAGKRAGMNGRRSGLFFDAMRVVRWSGARFALWENVPGVFSDNAGRGFAAVAGEMAGVRVDVPDGGWRSAGFLLGPEALVEWRILDAQFFGLAQRRRRVFALRDSGDWQGRPPVLLEPESLRGDPAPRREAREVAPTLPARSLGGGGLGTGFDCDGGHIASNCLNAGAMGRIDYETETLITHTLRADGFDASEDGTGRGTPIVPVCIQERAVCENPDAGPDGVGVRDDGLAYTLEARTVPQAVMTLAIRGRDEGSTLEVREDGTANAVLTPGGGRGGIGVGAVAFDSTQITSKANRSHPLAASAHPPAIAGMAVRRLTPVEAERLQGVPENFTLVPYRGKPMADSSRYKMLGNGFAIPVLAWIGRRIEEALRTAAEEARE